VAKKNKLKKVTSVPLAETQSKNFKNTKISKTITMRRTVQLQNYLNTCTVYPVQVPVLFFLPFRTQFIVPTCSWTLASVLNLKKDTGQKMYYKYKEQDLSL